MEVQTRPCEKISGLRHGIISLLRPWDLKGNILSRSKGASFPSLKIFAEPLTEEPRWLVQECSVSLYTPCLQRFSSHVLCHYSYLYPQLLVIKAVVTLTLGPLFHCKQLVIQSPFISHAEPLQIQLQISVFFSSMWCIARRETEPSAEFGTFWCPGVGIHDHKPRNQIWTPLLSLYLNMYMRR